MDISMTVSSIPSMLLCYGTYVLVLLVFTVQRVPHPILQPHLGNDSGLLAAQELLELRDLESNLDEALEGLRGVARQFCGASAGRNVALNVHAYSRALGASAAETEDDAGAVSEGDDLALVLRHGAVDGVGVVKVESVRDGEALAGALGLVLGALERALRDVHVDRVDELLRTLGGNLLVVVAREERAAVRGVVSTLR